MKTVQEVVLFIKKQKLLVRIMKILSKNFLSKIKYICKLITHDEYDGLLVNIWRNVHGLNGRKFMLTPLLKLTGELLLVEGPKARLDRMSVRWLYKKILQLEVTTVTKDKDGTLRHPEQHYSVVSSIKGVVA